MCTGSPASDGTAHEHEDADEPDEQRQPLPPARRSPVAAANTPAHSGIVAHTHGGATR